jgi:mono/diheme cytochrome c family protein
MKWIRPTQRVCIGACIALALHACGSSDEPGAPAAPAAPAAPTTPAAPETPTPAPDPGAEPDAAGVGTAGDAAAGAQSYAIFCASCHGAAGDAQTPIAQTLVPPPARHDDGAYMNALTDEHLLKVIKEGGFAVGKAPTMPPWGGSLSDDQIRDVIAFVRSLAKPPYQPPTP